MECSITVSEKLKTDGICVRPAKWTDASGRAICAYHAQYVKEDRKVSWVEL